MQRRNFIRRLAGMIASVAGAIAGITYLGQFAQKQKGPSKKIKIGKVQDYPVDTYSYLEDPKIFIYRDHEAMKAVSAVCTHLGCTIKETSEGFECPCHGSCYSKDGKVISGPAPVSLPWYKMEKAPDGNILVNLDVTTDATEKFFLEA
jgi:Rieske Fe-S protein